MEQIERDFLRKTLTFFDKLSVEDQSLLIDNVSTVSYKAGEQIYNGNADCIGVLVIKSGTLRPYILSEDGKEITLCRLGPGDVCVLSASCLIRGITFDIHIDAEKDSDVFLVNSLIYSQLQERNIYVENFSLRVAVEKFSTVIFAMEQVLFMPFDKRLATFLYDEYVSTGSKDIKLTHEQIARYMVSAREVVSRTMKDFERQGILSLHRGHLELLNMDRLKSFL